MTQLSRAAVLLLLSGGGALASDKPLTLLFTGDNAGEIATCGCRHAPSGGLARRKTVIEQARASGPVLVLDAGNTLFRAAGQDDAPSQERARFILEAMGELGTFAMAVGARDQGLPVDVLREQAGQAKVRLLSANLVGADGKPLFPGAAVAELSGTKVGVIGVSPPGPSGWPGVAGQPVVERVLAEARKLKGKVAVVVVLAAVPYADALQLSTQAKDAVDFILQSHEGRGVGTAQRSEGNHVLPSGERGRQVAKLQLGGKGKGAFVDLDERKRAQQMIELLENQQKTLKERLAKAQDPHGKQELEKALASISASRARHEKVVKGTAVGRTFSLEWMTLGPEVADDPGLKARVDRLEPPGSASH